jgi:hypothetical protein
MGVYWRKKKTVNRMKRPPEERRAIPDSMHAD